MHAQFVSTADGGLLKGVREALRGSERALICVAFTAEAGVRLIENELKELRARERPVQLVSTTVFGSTTPAALMLAKKLGVDVRTFDPSRGTFHPKVYFGIGRGGKAKAVVGSANLTGGLATNVEAGMYLEGSLRDEPLKSAWDWAEARWGEPIVELWTPPEQAPISAELIDPDLFQLLQAEVARSPVFMTLGSTPRPNTIRELTRTHLLVETERTRAERTPPQPIPAWMINVAWEYLKAHGRLTNHHLLHELRVHRSSAVCALLARMPRVRPFVEERRIGLELVRRDDA